MFELVKNFKNMGNPTFNSQSLPKIGNLDQQMKILNDFMKKIHKK